MQAATREQLGQDPVGRYVPGACWVHFCASPTLWGFIAWGRPSRQDAVELGRCLVLELDPPAVPHASIVDVSRLTGTDTEAFAALDLYLRSFEAKLRRQVLRLALVRPSGLHGAVVAGAFDVLPKPYPVEVFDSTAAALAWLDQDAPSGDPRPSSWLATLSELHATVSSLPPVVAALQALLDERVRSTSIQDAAARLGMSERTLQRRLADADTTFQNELRAARVRVAQRLMLESDEPLTAIAYDVGCASPQHFSALFRQVTGQSPRAWRKKHLE